jgi:hypothetical protein
MGLSLVSGSGALQELAFFVRLDQVSLLDNRRCLTIWNTEHTSKVDNGIPIRKCAGELPVHHNHWVPPGKYCRNECPNNGSQTNRQGH